MKRKILPLLVVLFLNVLTAFSQSMGPNSPTNSTSTGNGANFMSLTGMYTPADFNVAYTDLTDYPLCPNQNFCFYSKEAHFYGFGFSIPVNATITGIQVSLRKMISNPLPNIKDSVVQLLKGGNPAGSNLANNLQWPNTLTYVSYGDSSNLWGTTWTPTEINDANFGINLRVKNTDFAQLAQYDHGTIKVYFTLPSGIKEVSNTETLILIQRDEYLSILNGQDFIGSTISIYNLLGEKLLTIPKFQNEKIAIPSLNSGIYIVQIITSNGILSKKITIE